MKYSMFGYGSLISHNSLRKTIPGKHFTPALIKGYKRIFNLALFKKDADVLNIIKNRAGIINGVLFRVNDKELKKIKEREDDYNLEQTSAYDFLTGKKLCKCFVVTDSFVAIDKKHRKPNKKYFKMCREAAYHISREFGEFWDATTFTSDNKKISDWIKNNKSYNTIN